MATRPGAWWALAAGLAVSIAGDTARADTVELADGSSIVGTVVRLTETTLTIETAFAGTLEIPAEQVAGISTDEPVSVQLSSGDRLIGRLEGSGDRQRVRGTEAGDVTVQRRAVSAVWAAGEPSPEELDAQAELDRVTPKWSARLQFGLDGRTGNTERFSLTGRGEVRRRTDQDRMLIYAQANFNQENGVRSEQEYIGGVQYELDISDEWFVYGRGSLENDEFENIDLRTEVLGGVGYSVIREDDHEWRVRVGGGYRHESFTVGENEDEGILELAYNYRIDLNDSVRFVQDARYVPSLGDPGEDYRLELYTGVEVPISADEAWKLVVGMTNEYDNSPAEGVERLETKYFLTLAYDW